jgi:hypothetical protein
MNKLAKLLGILEIVKNNITLPYCQGAEFLGCSAFRFLFYTSEVEVINTEEISVTPTIKEIVANDMRKYAEEMNISERQLIKDFANNTNVVLRTLQRILEGNRKITPHVTTVVDIYSQIYNATSLAEIPRMSAIYGRSICSDTPICRIPHTLTGSIPRTWTA